MYQKKEANKISKNVSENVSNVSKNVSEKEGQHGMSGALSKSMIITK